MGSIFTSKINTQEVPIEASGFNSSTLPTDTPKLKDTKQRKPRQSKFGPPIIPMTPLVRQDFSESSIVDIMTPMTAQESEFSIADSLVSFFDSPVKSVAAPVVVPETPKKLKRKLSLKSTSSSDLPLPLPLSIPILSEKVCSKCKLTKAHGLDFYTSGGKTRSQCSSCMREQERIRYTKKRISTVSSQLDSLPSSASIVSVCPSSLQ